MALTPHWGAHNDPGLAAHVLPLLAGEIDVVVRVLHVPELPQPQVREVPSRPVLDLWQDPWACKNLLLWFHFCVPSATPLCAAARLIGR